ncbi:MAG: hypothetical protein JWM27_3040 [Gemmatimonadetes bacterium]|nr:hypothetical protein [Gemmatimonadota bacterium]
MGTTDPRIDAYIEKSAEFARPILAHIRQVVHDACPQVEETMKWSFPHFMYKGMLCGMAAFKQHCALGFWKGSLIVAGAAAGDGEPTEDAMGQFGRIATLADLPSDDVIAGYVREAMRLNDEGVKSPERAKKAPRPELATPDDLAAALASDDAARGHFESFSPSARREYVEWITEAKTGATRAKRLAQTLEWVAEGKKRNWKYENC